MKTMSAQEMRIAIAEKCGFELRKPGSDMNHEKHVTFERIPNYPEDLNAIHEAEKVFNGSPEKYSAYLGWLWKITNPTVDWTKDRTVHIQNYITWQFKRATAEQCCEAFCRVFWPERFEN